MTAAAEAADFGLWGWNLARNEVWGSARWLKLFGFTAGNRITFEQILERIHPDDREGVELEVRRAAANHTVYAGEFRVIRPDGTERWISSRGRMQEVANGNQDRMLGAARDITARKQADDRVRQLSFVVEQSPVSVVITDLRGTIIYVNRKFCEVSGYAVGECIGQNSRILQSGRSAHATYEDLWTRITRGETWRGEFQNRRKNGELYWEWEIISPLVDAMGKPTHFLGLKEDITARKQAELETAALRNSLAHVDRVSVLGQLASALAHELSQPLGAILRNAEAAEMMLQASSPDMDELRAINTDILRDDQRAGRVIDRLRSLLKRRELDLQPIDLPEVITETLSLVHANAAVHHVLIDCSIAPDLPRVRGDRVHLQQVLINLLVNAIDALGGRASPGRSIQVSAHPAGIVSVEVRVCDNGPGIPLPVLEQLFDPFFTTKPNGMGIGLAVSKTIVEAHKGRLWAENQPEGGACFAFTLPTDDREGAS
jgi:PAS domain S-box-containing protein